MEKTRYLQEYFRHMFLNFGVFAGCMKEAAITIGRGTSHLIHGLVPWVGPHEKWGLWKH